MVLHSLPPGVKVTNATATDGARWHLTKQSKCKYKNAELVVCVRCDNVVHVQCFLHLILDNKDQKVSSDLCHRNYYSFFDFVSLNIICFILLIFQVFTN